jgi:hypothetical protein
MLRAGRARVNRAPNEKGGAEAPPNTLISETRTHAACESSVLSPKLYFYLHYYFATLCAPAVVITLFVLYLFLKDRNKRL